MRLLPVGQMMTRGGAAQGEAATRPTPRSTPRWPATSAAAARTSGSAPRSTRPPARPGADDARRRSPPSRSSSRPRRRERRPGHRVLSSRGPRARRLSRHAQPPAPAGAAAVTERVPAASARDDTVTVRLAHCRDGPGDLDDAADAHRRGARAATGRRFASSTRPPRRPTRTPLFGIADDRRLDVDARPSSIATGTSARWRATMLVAPRPRSTGTCAPARRAASRAASSRTAPSGSRSASVAADGAAARRRRQRDAQAADGWKLHRQADQAARLAREDHRHARSSGSTCSSPAC